MKKVFSIYGTVVHSIDVLAKSWFDKTNGNTYFSSRIILNLDMYGNGIVITIPFMYGYGDTYLYNSFEMLGYKAGYETPLLRSPRQFCIEHNIVLRNGITRDCKKRDVTEWGVLQSEED